MDVLAVKPGLFFWTIINFLVLAIIMGKFFLPIILKAVKDREESIQKSIDESIEKNNLSQSKLEEATAKFADAQHQVAQIIAKGKEQAETVKATVVAEAEAQKKSMIEQANREIERSKEKAILELRLEVASLVVEATEKILSQKLDKDTHFKLVENYIEKLPRN
ncbi:MAG: F0F1 ATP synthase subunit B [Candidatus Kapabacteria bacterium]|nr:F0F1 ATP synthase subunit B [Candidatus Kapabacteria bacterium]